MINKRVAKEGLGADYIHELSRVRCLLGAVAISGLVVFLNGPKALLLLVFAVPAAFLMWAWSHRSIGGVVGDSLVAIAQLLQASVSVGVVVFLSEF